MKSTATLHIPTEEKCRPVPASGISFDPNYL
jgi:hypothetical protein